MTLDSALYETLDAVSHLEGGRFEDIEVYAKTGRSRRFALSPAGPAATYSQEAGWAVRAGDRRASFFAAATGAPQPSGPGGTGGVGGAGGAWPEADGQPIRLPEPVTGPRWSEPGDFDAPLMGEREALSLLERIASTLAGELPGARLLGGALEDGAGEIQILSSHGVRTRHRARLAALHLEAAGPERTGPTAAIYLAEREARRFHPLALARRLADRLLVTHEGRPVSRDRGTLLLAPVVMVRLLEGLRPLFLGPEAVAAAEALRDPRGRLGSDALTVLDNGRLPGGALEAPVDGEGVTTREVVLVDRGSYRGPLLPWWQSQEPHLKAVGCSRRPSWRDLPRPGFTHLSLRPQGGVGVASLLQDITRGYYLIDSTGGGTFDLAADRFSLPVCGFEVRSGRAAAPVAGSRLCGSISAFLRGVQGVARDLTFLPLDGMIGSPSALVTGLELRAG
jgi:predicted Zn-dependent protease